MTQQRIEVSFLLVFERFMPIAMSDDFKEARREALALVMNEGIKKQWLRAGPGSLPPRLLTADDFKTPQTYVNFDRCTLTMQQLADFCDLLFCPARRNVFFDYISDGYAKWHKHQVLMQEHNAAVCERQDVQRRIKEREAERTRREKEKLESLELRKQAIAAEDPWLHNFLQDLDDTLLSSTT
jgi:hypothetical protein